MQSLIGLLNQYASQSKYDFRGKSEPFNVMRVITASTTVKTYEDMSGDKEGSFHTLYCGADP